MSRLLNHRALPRYQWPALNPSPAVICLRRYRTLSRAPHIQSTKTGDSFLASNTFLIWASFCHLTKENSCPWVQGQVSLAALLSLLCLFRQVPLYTVSTAQLAHTPHHTGLPGSGSHQLPPNSFPTSSSSSPRIKIKTHVLLFSLNDWDFPSS